MSLFNLTRNLSLLCFLIAMSIASSVHALSLPNSKRSLARVQYLTNVERLQHGLSPLRPRILYEPSRVQGACAPEFYQYKRTDERNTLCECQLETLLHLRHQSSECPNCS